MDGNKMTKEIDRKDKGYPAIVTKIIKKGEDVDKKAEQRKVDYMMRWLCPTEEYNGRLGIRAKIPSFFEKIDDCCKKWTEKEMNKIQNYIKEKKVIPTLKFVPDEFQNFTKQVWWLIPFVIWKEDTASWIFVDKNGIHGAHPEDDDGPVIWGWSVVDHFEIEWPEENLCVLTVYSNNSDMYLTFSEFVLEGCGSYLSVIPSIYEIYKPVIEASGEFSWKHGAGGEGYKGFETQKELLDESVWDQALRPDPAFYS